MNKNILFTEKSNMITKTVLVIISLSIIVIFSIFTFTGMYKFTAENLWENILGMSLVLLSVLLIFLFRLTLTIYDEKLNIRFFPFINKTIYKKDIKSMKVTTISPLKNFGGWGIKRSKTYGQGYTTKGNEILAIELKNGKKYAVSIFDKPKLKSILKNYKLK